MLSIWHFLVHWTGSDYPTGLPGRYGQFQPYDLYSGLLGLSVFGLFLTQVRKHNCHKAWCLRLGHHPFTDAATGATYLLCRKHHPATLDSPPTQEIIDLIHARNQGLE